MGATGNIREAAATLSLKREHWHVAGAIVLAVVLLLWASSVRDFWFDEQLTRDRAINGFSEVYEGNALGYFAIIIGWAKLFGTSALALRVPSMIAAVAAIPLLWGGVRRMYSIDVANAAVWIFAAHPLVVRYGVEARGYAFVLVASAATFWLLHNAWTCGSRRWWVLFGVVAAAATWSHLTGGWLLAIAAARPRRRLLLAWAVAGVLLLPLAAILVGVRTEVGSLLAWTTQWPLYEIVIRTAIGLAGGTWAAAVLTVLVAGGLDRLTATWIFVPLVGSTISSMLGEPLLWPRMMVVCAPAVAVAAAVAWSRLPARSRGLVAVMLGVLLAVSIWSVVARGLL